MTSRALLVLAVLTVLVAINEGYKKGAPADVCGSFEPGHHTTTQTSPTPYVIGASPAIVARRGIVSVTIRGSIPFRGYLIQAVQRGTKQVVNGFFKPRSGITLLNCPPGIQNTVTHSEPGDKSDVTLYWEAPEDFTGQVVFRATVVKDGATYWTDVVSRDVVTIQ